MPGEATGGQAKRSFAPELPARLRPLAFRLVNSFRAPAVLLLLGATLSALAILASGCGASPQEQAQARKQAAEKRRLEKKAAGLEEEIRQLKAQQKQLTAPQAGPEASPTTTAASPGPAGPSSDCGGGVAAGPRTSCAFALNTAREWVDTSGGTTLQVYSPTTRVTYTVKCATDRRGTTCKGGRGDIVYIP